MKTHHRFAGRVAWVLGFLGSLGLNADENPDEVAFANEVQPVFERYCYRCHGETRPKGGVNLSAFADAQAVAADRELFERVLLNLRNRDMPPADKPQPTVSEREAVLAFLDRVVFPLDCSQPDPGRVTIRRLNRAEYNNTIRDLVGIEFRPADDFPADDSGYGFDNIGDVLSLPPVLMEKYLAAAEAVLDQAIVADPSTYGPVRTFVPAKLKSTAAGGPYGQGAMALNREGALQAPVAFAHDGEYLLRVRAFGQQAGNEPAKMEVRLDTRSLQVVDVEAEETSPDVFTLRFPAGAGDRQLALAYINNYRNPSDPDPNRRDRNLIIEAIELVGPLGQPLPESHTRIFFRDATPDTHATTARAIVGRFAERAWRRPLTDGELDRLAELFERVEAHSDSFIASVKVVLEAVLISPQFLFRGELQPDPDNPASVYPIDGFALASRLSYFLWSSMPDEALFEEARQGTLRLNLTGQVLRMLRHAKSRALVENFAGQWLQLRNLRLVAPDPGTFPDFDEALRSAMVQETERFFDHVMREDRSVLDFMEADYTFVNGRLARHYGLPDVQGERFERVTLTGTHRGGVLTHGSVLTLTSNPTRTSPVKRGKWVLENLLGSAPPPPPPDVPELSEERTAVLSGTLRQRMEQHRADPNCATCHERMDPIGFGMENFDGIGAWRQQDGDFPIDPAGRLSSGEAFSGIDELRVLLVQEKRDAFVHCLAERMLTYALGRGLEYYDECALERIREGLEREDYRFSTLILEIVRSVPFQMRRGEGDRADLLAQAPEP